MTCLVRCVLTSFAVLCLSVQVIADDAENRSVAFVERLGGSVTRSEEIPGKPVTGVILKQTKLTNTGLKELGGFSKLATLDLTLTEVTDAGLKELTQFTNLTTLDLMATRVTDAGLKELAKIQNLTELRLVSTGCIRPMVVVREILLK